MRWWWWWKQQHQWLASQRWGSSSSFDFIMICIIWPHVDVLNVATLPICPYYCTKGLRQLESKRERNLEQDDTFSTFLQISFSGPSSAMTSVKRWSDLIFDGAVSVMHWFDNNFCCCGTPFIFGGTHDFAHMCSDSQTFHFPIKKSLKEKNVQEG